MVWPKFAHWLLLDAEFGVLRLAKNQRSREAILAVGDLYARKIAGNNPKTKEWRAAAAAASYLTEYASRAAYFAACSSTFAGNAANAVNAVNAANAVYVSRTHYSRMADKLIELMSAAL